MTTHQQEQQRKMGSAILVSLIGMVLFAVVGGTCVWQGAKSHATSECKDLCGALNQKYVQYTDYGCVCENTDGERTVHTGFAGE
jgi:flagellar basal body-associated protein FliL